MFQIGGFYGVLESSFQTPGVYIQPDKISSPDIVLDTIARYNFRY